MFFKNFWPALAWAIVIFLLCSAPGKSIPSTDWMRWFNLDKWIHAFFYFVLFLLLYRGYRYEKNRATYFIVSFLICILYGIGIELIQAFFLPDRSGDVPDAVANSMGAIFAVIGLRIITKKWPWKSI